MKDHNYINISKLIFLIMSRDAARGGYLGQFLLGMCRWPLRASTPLWSILWSVIDPIIITFGLLNYASTL